MEMVERGRFHRRDVKKDGRGIYIHYGSCRLRPYRPETSKFRKGQVVSFVSEECFSITEIGKRVFTNALEYEVWKTIPPKRKSR